MIVNSPGQRSMFTPLLAIGGFWVTSWRPITPTRTDISFRSMTSSRRSSISLTSLSTFCTSLPNRRVGAFAAAELVYPNESAAEGSGNPIIEALAAFWEYYERDLWPSIQMAHREGTLFFSMEAVPQSLTCKGKGDFEGCGQTYEYAGRQSPTYCDHLNLSASRKILHKPVFTGGALITPGTKPGWRNAHIKELSKLIEDELDQADLLFREIADEAPHMNTLQIENVMAWFLAQANS